MSRTLSIKPICEMLTKHAQRIWHEEAERMVAELHARVTARCLALEQQLRVDYQRDVDLMETKLYVVLPGYDTIDEAK